MNDYEAKQEARRERYAELAEKAAGESSRRHETARAIGSMIPFGQPILVGHHSEGRHRADLKRIDTNMRKSIEASEKANYYQDKAENYGKHGISSDDPEAIVKLRAKLARMEEKRDLWKLVNKAHTKYLKNPDSLDDFGFELGWVDIIINYKPAYSWTPHPVAPYQFTNLGGNIRRVRERIEELETAETLKPAEDVKGNGFTLSECPDDNRIRFYFDGKPDEATRKLLKSRGFRWSPFNKAWQRQLNANGRYAAECVTSSLNA